MLIALLVTRQIIRALAKLVRASHEIAEGNLNLETGIHSHDEIGHLADSFDKMTVQLRKRTEELEELVRLQAAILSSIADGVLVQDRDGQIAQLNRAAEKILSHLSPTFPELSAPDHIPLAERILQHLAQPPSEEANENEDDPIIETTDYANLTGVESGEKSARNFNIGERSVSTRAAPVIADTGEVLGSVTVLRDITLEVESEKLKNKLIESLSHELLTPITPLRMNLQLLQMTAAGKLEGIQLQAIEKIDKHATELNGLITSLLDFAQIEAEGLSATEFEEFDLAELVEMIVEDNHIRLDEDADLKSKKLTFRAHLQASSLLVNADETRLRRTLNALLDNAMKYNRKNGTVDLYLHQQDGYAQVDVVDSGRGIDETLRRYITKQAFIRQVSGDDTERGNGLSLYLASKVMQAHQGKIWFESVVGQGSTFSLAIPLYQSADNETATVAETETSLEHTRS